MQPGYNWSDLNSFDFDPTDFSDPSLSWNTLYHHFPSLNETYQFPPPHKAHLVPVEIFSEIFQYTVQADPRSQINLMLVCRHWHSIMLSTPGMRSHLRIDMLTRKQDVERPGRGWLLDVTIDSRGRRSAGHIGPFEFYACLAVAAEAASQMALTCTSFISNWRFQGFANCASFAASGVLQTHRKLPLWDLPEVTYQRNHYNYHPTIYCNGGLSPRCCT